MAKILRLDGVSANEHRQIGRVHIDGSITFRGRRYRTLKEVPPDCRGLRLDVPSHCQWRALYRQLAGRQTRWSDEPTEPPRIAG